MYKEGEIFFWLLVGGSSFTGEGPLKWDLRILPPLRQPQPSTATIQLGFKKHFLILKPLGSNSSSFVSPKFRHFLFRIAPRDLPRDWLTDLLFA